MSRRDADEMLDPAGRADELEDLNQILATPSGRRLVWRLLNRSGVLRVAFHGNSRDAFEAGQRHFGALLLVDLLDLDPALFAGLCAEFRKTAHQVRHQLSQKREDPTDDDDGSDDGNRLDSNG